MDTSVWTYQLMRLASILVNIPCSHLVGDTGIPSSCNERLLKRVLFMARTVRLAVIKWRAHEKKKKKKKKKKKRFIQRCTSIGAGLEVRKRLGLYPLSLKELFSRNRELHSTS